MKNYFFRIVYSGYNINGHCKYKIYGYKKIDWAENQFDYISTQDMDLINIGRKYKENHYILTIWEKREILEKLTATFNNDFNYIFE
jgi:hypothetical protein